MITNHITLLQVVVYFNTKLIDELSFESQSQSIFLRNMQLQRAHIQKKILTAMHVMNFYLHRLF